MGYAMLESQCKQQHKQQKLGIHPESHHQPLIPRVDMRLSTRFILCFGCQVEAPLLLFYRRPDPP